MHPIDPLPRIAPPVRAPGHRSCVATVGLTALSFALIVAGCETDDAGSSAKPITVATWNLGLAYNFVPLTNERREQTMAAAAAIDADLVCLQEVWAETDVAAMTAAAKAAGFTDVYVDPTKEDVTGLPIACTEGDTKDLAPCAQSNCVPSDNLVGCVQSKCANELAALSGQCLGCLASHLDLDFNGILDACAKSGGTYSYGGHHGLLLLSRLPLAKTERLVLDSTLIRRAVLRAQVSASGGRPALDVYCTHLTAGLSSTPYKGTYASWEAEQSAQIDAMGKWMDDGLVAGRAQLLMGDLNCGPAVGTDVTAEMPANWQKVDSLGVVDAWLASGKATCTFCGDNKLVASGADKGGENSILDHIALRGWIGTTAATRIGDTLVEVTTATGKQTTNYSDHYGLRAVLTP